MTPEEEALIEKLAGGVNFSPELMYDLIIEGQIIVKYEFDVKTGEFKTERVG